MAELPVYKQSRGTRAENNRREVNLNADMDHFLAPLLLFLLCSAARAVNGQYNQNYQKTTPVPILKQIDRHNEDGSYSYGYEAADGSFKIESKYPTGEVYGKYGFVDDTGKVREIEYGASQRGFEPAGTDINVPPSTVQGNGVANPNDPEDDGQYREDPSIYHTDPKYTNGEYYRPISKRPSNQIRPNAAPATAYDFSALPVPMRSQYQPNDQSQYQPQQYQQDYRYQDQFQYQQPLRRPSNPRYYETPESQPQIQRDYANNYGQ